MPRTHRVVSQLQRNHEYSRPAADKGAARTFVSAKVDGTECILRVSDIQVVTSCENYTQISMVGGRPFLVRRTMRQWLTVLPESQFARVHRGLIVNLERLGSIERGSHRSMILRFVREMLPPLAIKRRHWAGLRSRLEAWRAGEDARRRRRPKRAIAVLPFANLSSNCGNDIFCDGISEELLNALSKVPSLRIAARTSSFSFKGRNLPISEIARELEVDFVIEGSVRTGGTRVRVTARLVDARKGVHLWSDSFDRELTHILELQTEMAGAIARNLQSRLPGGRPPATFMNPDAHRLVIEGRHYWSLRTGEGLGRAEKAFARAIALMPNYAPAHAGQADVCAVRAMYRLADGEPSAADDLARVHFAAHKALEIDATLAEPHAAIGFALFHEGRLSHALQAFPKAFALNPNYATGYQFYAWTLCAAGQMERALEEYAKAIVLDPLAFINLDRYAAMLALARKFPEALEMSERAAALRPDVFVGNISQRATILMALERTEEAVALARAVRHTTLGLPYRRTSDADAIFVLQRAGLVREAADYAAEVLARLAVGNYLRGFVLAAIDRHADAIAAVQTPPSIMLPFLYWSPLWAGARQHPAFAGLMIRSGRAGRTHPVGCPGQRR